MCQEGAEPMSKKDEALKLALEALRQIDEAMPFPVAKFAQAVIREALAEQPAQPSKPWVGLTPAHLADCILKGRGDEVTTWKLIESKLKELNT